MNNIELFKNETFGQIRTLLIEDEVWFVGKDVAEALGYSEPRSAISKKVDEEDRGVAKMETPSGKQDMTIINESGLYSLILSSKLPQAKEFKRWVTNEILPSIRKHGGYLTPQKIEEVLLNPDTIIKLATDLKEEKEKNVTLTLTNKQQEQQIKELQPKALFAESVEASKTSILIGELAKILKQNGVDTGQNKLFEKLREEGYLMKTGSSRNLPTQRAMELGLFEIKESVHNNPDGSIRVNKTTKVTGKGQIYFINKYCKKIA